MNNANSNKPIHQYANTLKSPDSMYHLLKNHLKTGLRFLWKTRTFSGINLLGLAIGIATAAMAYLFLSNQFAYDRFHQNADRLYRLNSSLEFEGVREKMGGASYIMGEELPKQAPGVELGTRVKNDFALLRTGGEFDYQSVHYADRALFDMLDFSFTQGSPGAFESPNQIVVAESFAETLIDKKELRLLFGETENLFEIVGVFKDLPSNSTLQPQIIVPFTFWKGTVPTRRLETWFDINMNAFILRKAETSKEQLEAQLNEVLAANFDVSEMKAQLHLQPFTEMHLDASLELGNGLLPGTNHQILWVVFLVGLLCLLISCFNYSNFALGNLLSRSKEVAVRKILGARKSTIFRQFISESFLSTFFASLIALILIQLLLPLFSNFIGENYSFRDLWSWRFASGFLLTLLLTTLLAGAYPALVLSARKITLALSGKLKVGGKDFLSWSLMMLQVSLAIFMVVGMITTNRQLRHLINFDLGYNDQNVLTVDIVDSDEQKAAQFKDRLQQLSTVEKVSYNSGYNGTNYEDGNLRIKTRHFRTDADFVDLLDIQLVAGRNFDRNIQTDNREAVLVNETFVKMARLTDPIGQRIPFRYGDFENPQIIGVVADYHFRSPKVDLQPLVMYQSPAYQIQEVLIKLRPGFTGQRLGEIESLWREIYPTRPLSYSWLDEINAAQMRSESQIKKLATTGSLIAIILAALGLFGLVGTHVKQRLKEVSIRKINGASPLDIYLLFSKKFSKWLLLGFIFGLLPALFVLHNWLNHYPERIEINWDIALFSILICTLVFATIIFLLLYRVTRLNPVVYLQEE